MELQACDWHYYSPLAKQLLNLVYDLREEAITGFLRNPFFQAWDPAVLKVYVEAGLYDTKDHQGNPVVRLKMPGIYESIVFAERTVGPEAYAGLPYIEERIPIRWIVPGTDTADEFGGPGATAERVWTRPKNSSNIRITGAGHLVSAYSDRVASIVLTISPQIAQERPIDLGEYRYRSDERFLLLTFNAIAEDLEAFILRHYWHLTPGSQVTLRSSL